jgi:hypothetical protein
MTSLTFLFPILVALLFSQGTNLQLAYDINKDAQILGNTSVFISDNATFNPSLQTVDSDLQLFLVTARIDLSQSRYSAKPYGKHQVQAWRFEEGSNIRAIYQIDTSLALDTVVTQRYLENRAPTQERIMNNFRFRTYAVSTRDSVQKLYYLTEDEQGLVEYRIDDRHVELVYSRKKQGLSDVMPKLKDELDALIVRLSKE